jgi:regulator of cell morphogenesis and NO signaling
VNIKDTTTIGEIVADDIRTANIFQKYGLDFCCGGKQRLKSACDENEINYPTILDELDKSTFEKADVIDYQSMAIDSLVTHIIDKHHKYIYETGPITLQFIKRVAKVHGERYPYTIEMAEVCSNLLSELHHHMMKEEQVLFPYIMNLVKMETGELSTNSFRQFVSNPIRVMMIEHDQAGDLLKQLQELSNNFTPPNDACTTFRAAFSNLKELDDDVILHIHLENNILFPKAVTLENNLTESILDKK